MRCFNATARSAGLSVLSLLLMVVAGCSDVRSSPDLTTSLDADSLEWIGTQIFQNECAGRKTCLVHWNKGEAFPSLGIGHFIWYPTDVDGPFVESFPLMIEFLSDRGVVMPDWLAVLDPFDAPWKTRDALIQTSNTPQVEALRDFLMASRGPQAEFLVHRASRALGRIVGAAPEAEWKSVSDRIEALSSTPGGVYTLIDYVNFKGEGLAVTERYNGEGWGLLQVLLAMDDSEGKSALQAFREAAGRVLARRADNAAEVIESQRWLAGWLNRIDTYKEPD